MSHFPQPIVRCPDHMHMYYRDVTAGSCLNLNIGVNRGNQSGLAHQLFLLLKPTASLE